MHDLREFIHRDTMFLGGGTQQFVADIAIIQLFGNLSGYPLQSFFAPFFIFPKGYGFGPLGLLLCWMGVVVSLYPACRYYAHIKKTRNSVLLSYL